MAKLEIILSHEEVHANIPYALICMTRYGSCWNTMRRKRRWKMEFTEAEREAASALFSKAQSWTVGRGVPDTVRMSTKTYALWQKLGAFCGSL